MTDDILRSRLFSELIRKREDREQQKVIEKFAGYLDFEPIERLMISRASWNRVIAQDIEPKLVFAHPSILSEHPKTSLYYRGIALLSRKRAQQAAAVTSWEDGTRTKPVSSESAYKVCCLYNTMISSIIEGSPDWTLDDGYRNIIATMGITFDGLFRNKIGHIAEDLVKRRIVSWLTGRSAIVSQTPRGEQYQLPRNTLMNFGSEPDIEFVRGDRLIATIEIKGGRDPAGALERLGAMSKSFAETPPGCVNFLIAGVVTPEMKSRLNAMGNVKVYMLDDIARDGDQWDDFTNEVFHHAVRVL